MVLLETEAPGVCILAVPVLSVLTFNLHVFPVPLCSGLPLEIYIPIKGFCNLEVASVLHLY